MIIKCSNCGARYRVDDNLVADGPKRFKCKKCGTVLLVKPPAAASPPPAGEKLSGAASPATKAPQQAQEQVPSTAETGRDEGAETPPPQAPAEQESAAAETGQAEEESGLSESAPGEDGELSPEEIATRQQQSLQEKLEDRRRQMEDEISGRLNKAALETLDFEVLSELAHQIQDIQSNPDVHLEKNAKLFSCIKCITTFCLYPDDPRVCTNCTGDVSLVRADDILKQFGMFG